jgi:AcrR family transcriptional regulator
VLDAAGELLLQRGYRATTIKQIAARAQVSPEMIYQAFGSKRGLVKRLYDVTIAGDDDEIPLGDRAQIQQALAAPSLASALWL